jgi:hypothetical protein
VTLFIIANRVDANYTPIGLTPKLSYQGRLVDPETGDNMPDGTYSMVFRLYDSPSAPTTSAIDSETKSVSVTNGIFAVELDFADSLYTISTIGSNEGMSINDRYLGIAVQGDPEMTPRQKLQFAPYAVSAIDSVTVAGNTVNDLFLDDHLYACTLKLSNMTDFTTSSSTAYIPLKYTEVVGPNTLADCGISIDSSTGIITLEHPGGAVTKAIVSVTANYTAVPNTAEPQDIILLQTKIDGALVARSLANSSPDNAFAMVSSAYSGYASTIQFLARPANIVTDGGDLFSTATIVVRWVNR